jgi:hypothetical protein
MIFDSKRRQASEAEAETATLDEASSGAPGEAGTPVDAKLSAARQDTYLEDDARRVAAAGTDRVPARASDAAAARAVERNGTGSDERAEDARRSDRNDLVPLFPTELAEEFRGNWDAVQIGFVDDPRQAVQKADELVNQVLHSLSESFSGERSRVEAQLAQADPTTEDLRMALRRYRSFLHRLLAL